MKSRLTYLFSIVLAVFIAFSCSQSSRHEIKIIHTKGVTMLFNLSKSSTTFGPAMLKDSSSGIALQDGDMLYGAYGKDKFEFIFQYTPGLGKQLVFKWDSLQPFKISLNGQVFTASLQDSASWIWIKNKSRETLSGLHSILLLLPLTDDEMKILSGLAQVKPNLNLYIEAQAEMKQSEKILSMFKPEWLYFLTNDSVTISDSLLLKFGEINSLYLRIGSKTNVNINQLSQLKNLKKMILVSPQDKGSGIDFKDFKKLSSFSLNESTLKSTRNINLPEDIGSLFFMHCDNLTDVSSLASYKKLSTLGFSQCMELKNISAIKGMKNLTWLSLPPSINQSQFDSLIPSLPSLQVLEMIYCDPIKNLEVLQKAKGLRALTLATENFDTTSLYRMKNLELLVIGSRSASDSIDNKIQKLKTQLPNTLVVPGGGFCLGSGWILLIIPMVLLGVVLFRRTRQTHNGLNS